ncbi:MAG: DivIVA domain-containing protein [Acidimicrobiales bacterium]
MDITPQVINEVEFRSKVRGYDPDEVDDFLEKMAIAVGQLQDRLADASERAGTAERRVAGLEDRLRQQPAGAAGEVGAGGEAETISRAILTAQRTADTMVAEAKDSAERTVGKARQEAHGLLSEAQANAKRLKTEAEEAARKAHEDTKRKLLEQINVLETTRGQLHGDVEMLEAHIDEQRLRVRSSVDELQRLLDDPTRLRMAPLPELAGVDLAGLEDTLPGTEREPAEAEDAESVEPVPAPPDATDSAEADEPAGGQAAEDDTWRPPPGSAAPDGEPTAASTIGAPSAGQRDPGDPAMDVPQAAGDAGGRPATAPVGAPGADADDDAYLAELRQAIANDDLGPGSGLFDQDRAPSGDADPRSRSRFGRRR